MTSESDALEAELTERIGARLRDIVREEALELLSAPLSEDELNEHAFFAHAMVSRSSADRLEAHSYAKQGLPIPPNLIDAECGRRSWYLARGIGYAWAAVLTAWARMHDNVLRLADLDESLLPPRSAELDALLMQDDLMVETGIPILPTDTPVRSLDDRIYRQFVRAALTLIRAEEPADMPLPQQMRRLLTIRGIGII